MGVSKLFVDINVFFFPFLDCYDRACLVLHILHISSKLACTMGNRLCELLDIDFPLIQAGMVWCSGWRLASAVSNCGALGVIGSGSMYPDALASQLKKCQSSTAQPFGVNVPLMYPQVEEHMRLIMEAGVRVVITSAGSPKKWTSSLQAAGCVVGHVVSSSSFAKKSEDAGVDFVIAEGFEAGGHNGREETTTLCLLPEVVDAVQVPVVAAGGIADGRSMFACMALGAEGVQVGSRFVASEESSAHPHFKDSVVRAGEGATELTLKELTPVRLLEGGFLETVRRAYAEGANEQDLRALLGRGRAKRGMLEGDLEEGELEIGQVASRIRAVKPAADIVHEFKVGFRAARADAAGLRFDI